LPLFFKFRLEYPIRKIQQNQKGPHWNEPADQLLVSADDVNLLGTGGGWTSIPYRKT